MVPRLGATTARSSFPRTELPRATAWPSEWSGGELLRVLAEDPGSAADSRGDQDQVLSRHGGETVPGVSLGAGAAATVMAS